MKKYRIPVTYEMCGVVEVAADSVLDAMITVDDPKMGLPKNATYVEGSFKIVKDYVTELN